MDGPLNSPLNTQSPVGPPDAPAASPTESPTESPTDNIGSWRIMEKCGMTFEKMQTAYNMECKFYAISKEEFIKGAVQTA